MLGDHRRTRRTYFAGALVLGLLVPLASCVPSPNPMDRLVHLNQLQVVGSHNSYHVLATQEERDLRRGFIGDEEDGLEYAHDPLAVQFSRQEVRQIELDVFDDPEGGLYADPLIRRVTGGGPLSPDHEQRRA